MAWWAWWFWSQKHVVPKHQYIFDEYCIFGRRWSSAASMIVRPWDEDVCLRFRRFIFLIILSYVWNKIFRGVIVFRKINAEWPCTVNCCYLHIKLKLSKSCFMFVFEIIHDEYFQSVAFIINVKILFLRNKIWIKNKIKPFKRCRDLKKVVSNFVSDGL